MAQGLKNKVDQQPDAASPVKPTDVEWQSRPCGSGAWPLPAKPAPTSSTRLW